MSTREIAHQILDSMNEEQLVSFITLFKVNNTPIESDDFQVRNEAYENLKKIIRSVPNLDYDNELVTYREEKYGA